MSKSANDAAASHEPLDFVVGIGSSAGGLEALEGLLGSLQPSGRAAFIVAQHLAPEHPSLLTELLTRETTLRVATASDGLELEPDLIAIAPPGQDVTVEGATIRLRESQLTTGSHPSIDQLLESIATSWGDHAVGVILSGTGSDGAYGMRRVKATDGLTVVQSPESAKFDSMPRAALGLGIGDLVLEPAEIGERLSRLGTESVDWLGELVPTPAPDALSSIVAELRRATGVDFSRYKESTLLRQVRRRMAIRQVTVIDDYLPLLAADAAEPAALMGGLLVTVTSFFRDPEAFDALRERLSQYLAGRSPADPFRVWVPGCATGEEVYSVAMVISDLMGGPEDLAARLKVFGTDLDESALAIARRGVYPTTAIASIPKHLAGRYLLTGPQGAEVVPELRDAVVFARHNVGQDPPFARLDLISCRNTLIYFTPSLQRRVLDMFAYGLLPGGLLFLGASESLAADTAGFDSVDAGHRIFMRTQESVTTESPQVALPALRPAGVAPAASVAVVPRGSQVDAHVAALEALTAMRVGPALVLNERHEVVEVIGDVSPYCRIAQGRPSTAAASLLRPELAAEARALLLLVRAGGERMAGQPISLPDVDHDTRIIASPLPVGSRHLTVLEFVTGEQAPGAIMTVGERAPEFDAELERLERELLDSQESLQGSLVDLETAHEELLASNEELQASSEELQSSYEELATLNEELQASNEEMAATNRQLRQRTDELDRVSRTAQAGLDDFTRVTDALREVVWQRDTSFSRLLYISQRVEDLTGLTPANLGEDATALDRCIVEEDRERVWATRNALGPGWSVDYRLRARDGTERWVTERGSLVRGVGGGERVVGTLTDVTDQVNAIRREGQQRQIFEAVFQAPLFGVAVLDSETRVLAANKAFCDTLRYEPDGIVRMPIAAFLPPSDVMATSEGPSGGPLLESQASERQLLRRDGTYAWAKVTVERLPEPVGDAAYLVMLQDDTAVHEQTSELARRTATDSATGLLNREHFQRALRREIEMSSDEGTWLALVWIDADLLKDVNARFGHAAGDRVLQTAAERLESVVRPSDVVGRIGGDEFGVILVGYDDAPELDSILDRMLWAFRQPAQMDDDTTVAVTASMGVATFPEDGSDVDGLMRAADTAMNEAKSRGGDAFEYFRGEMTRAAEQRRALRDQIDVAIRERQFEMYYQPILTPDGDELWGVEALVRWNREGEAVPAADFIEACESSGQIRALAPLTLSLFREDLEVLHTGGVSVGRACVNLSVSQLADRDFADLVGWWPSPDGLAGVVIEVTESVFLPDHGRALTSIGRLTRLGAEVSIDDFGSGYSNLTLLETLAPAFIKLDRSYLATIGSGVRGPELLAAAIQMAHAVGAKVVVEGVESEEHAALAAGLGADLLQGYHLARPMSRDALVAWIAQRADRG